MNDQTLPTSLYRFFTAALAETDPKIAAAETVIDARVQETCARFPIYQQVG